MKKHADRRTKQTNKEANKQSSGKGNVFLVHPIKACRVVGRVRAASVINLDPRCRLVVNFTLRPSYCPVRSPVPIEQELGWVLGRSGRFGEETILLFLSTFEPRNFAPDALPTELPNRHAEVVVKLSYKAQNVTVHEWSEGKYRVS